jgi:16S rRNA processing protein RimM
MIEDPRWVWLARIRRPQGRKGEVYADILTDFPAKFSERRRLWLLEENVLPVKPHEVELANFWLHKKGVVLHFSGFSTITQAETLAGQIVAISRAERAPLGEDEAYIGDLIGCTLVDVAEDTSRGRNPSVLGTIQDVDRSSGQVAMLVVHNGANEILIPFAKSYLRRMDIASKRIEMVLPEGLADLNSSSG